MLAALRRVLRVLRFGLKWTLAGLGLFVCVGLAIIEYQEGRIGLGHGVVFAIVAGTAKGILTATTRRGGDRDTQSL